MDEQTKTTDEVKKPSIIERATAAISGKAEIEQELAAAQTENGNLAEKVAELVEANAALSARGDELAEAIESLKAEHIEAIEAAEDTAEAKAADIVGETLGVKTEDLPEKIESGEEDTVSTKAEAMAAISAAETPEARRATFKRYEGILKG